MSKRCTSAWVAMRRGREDRRRTSGGGLTGMERVGRREGGETGGARLCPGALVEPRHNAVDIDGGGGRDVLQVGLRYAPIPGPSQAKGAYSLGERPFNTGAALIALLPFGTGIPRLRRLEGLILCLRMQLQGARRFGRLGAARARGTAPAVLLAKAHLDVGGARSVDPLGPARRGAPLGTVHLLALPIHDEVGQRVGPLDFGLPVGIRARRAPQRDALFITASDKQLGADIST